MLKSALILVLLGAVTTLAQSADEARPPSCGKYEYYAPNSAICHFTCDNFHLEPVMGACAPTSACLCIGGYVRNSEGVCIEKGKCPPKPCQLNEHYEKDTYRCQISCATLHLEPIMGPCGLHSDCFCNDGYVRDDRGICVKRGSCPPRCPPSERYLNQTSQCQITCKTLPLEPYMGPCWPTSGCFCWPGYVRNDAGICIRKEECTKVCPINEHYEQNTNRCQISCANMHLEPIMGPCSPTSACFCNQGYVRNDKGICVLRGSCPKPPQACGPNEHSTDCYNDCQTTCKNRIIGDGRVCTLACTRTGCVCDEGYLRHDNGTCVPVNECSPAACNKGEVYTDCGSSCPVSCETRGNTCKVCTQQCVAGCFCEGNKIRGPDGTCINPKQCPPRICPKNEVFNNCPPTCPPTENCSNIWSRIDCSNAVDCCAPSCRCKSGYFRNDQGVCISSQQCMGNPSSKAQAETADSAAEAEASA